MRLRNYCAPWFSSYVFCAQPSLSTCSQDTLTWLTSRFSTWMDSPSKSSSFLDPRLHPQILFPLSKSPSQRPTGLPNLSALQLFQPSESPHGPRILTASFWVSVNEIPTRDPPQFEYPLLTSLSLSFIFSKSYLKKKYLFIFIGCVCACACMLLKVCLCSACGQVCLCWGCQKKCQIPCSWSYEPSKVGSESQTHVFNYWGISLGPHTSS